MTPLAKDPSPGPVRRVLVSYRSTRRGRAALSHAVALARDLGVPLSVVCVVTYEPTDVGCTRCRQMAASWNRGLLSRARGQLREAARIIASDVAVEYSLAVGPAAGSIARAAERGGADVIVLPRDRVEGIRRLLATPLAERLRDGGGWRVIVAPAAPGHGGGSRCRGQGVTSTLDDSAAARRAVVRADP
ncbi:MAG: universal stress protein [Actinobacteria bacterium]|nr:universal stress protein [Actinomycetota bacterium]